MEHNEYLCVCHYIWDFSCAIAYRFIHIHNLIQRLIAPIAIIYLCLYAPHFVEHHNFSNCGNCLFAEPNGQLYLLESILGRMETVYFVNRKWAIERHNEWRKVYTVTLLFRMGPLVQRASITDPSLVSVSRSSYEYNYYLSSIDLRTFQIQCSTWKAIRSSIQCQTNFGF